MQTSSGLLDGDQLFVSGALAGIVSNLRRSVLARPLLVLRCLPARDWVAVFVRGPDRTSRRIDRPVKHRRGVMVIQAYAAGAAAAAATSAAAATKGKSYARPLRADVLLIEHVECRQADVGDFLLMRRHWLADRRQRMRAHAAHCGGGSARQRQRQTGGSQHGNGIPSTLSLRSFFRLRHDGGLPCPRTYRPRMRYVRHNRAASVKKVRKWSISHVGHSSARTLSTPYGMSPHKAQARVSTCKLPRNKPAKYDFNVAFDEAEAKGVSPSPETGPALPSPSGFSRVGRAFQPPRSSSGSFATFAAMRRASSRVSKLAADPAARLLLEVHTAPAPDRSCRGR